MINDETILFQDNNPSNSHKTLTLNESYKNFEYILFGYFDINNYLGMKHVPTSIMDEYDDIFLGGIVGRSVQSAASINVLGTTQIQQRNKSNSYTKMRFIKGLNRKV